MVWTNICPANRWVSAACALHRLHAVYSAWSTGEILTEHLQWTDPVNSTWWTADLIECSLRLEPHAMLTEHRTTLNNVQWTSPNEHRSQCERHAQLTSMFVVVKLSLGLQWTPSKRLVIEQTLSLWNDDHHDWMTALAVLPDRHSIDSNAIRMPKQKQSLANCVAVISDYDP